MKSCRLVFTPNQTTVCWGPSSLLPRASSCPGPPRSYFINMLAEQSNNKATRQSLRSVSRRTSARQTTEFLSGAFTTYQLPVCAASLPVLTSIC